MNPYEIRGNEALNLTATPPYFFFQPTRIRERESEREGGEIYPMSFSYLKRTGVGEFSSPQVFLLGSSPFRFSD